MFDFGIKKRNTSTKSIMLDEVDDKYYIPQEKLDRFYEETSNGGTRGLKRIGFIMSMDEYETAPNERPISHQSNRVYSSEGGCPTLSAINIVCMITCPPKKGQGTISYKGKKYSVRKLVPQECWRIQGIPDFAFERAEKVLSEVKQYERAGRAICIPMLESIFKDFFTGKEFSKLRVLEAFSGIGSQRIALDCLGIPYESVGIMEVDRYGILSYDAIHNHDNPVDYSIGKTDEEMVEEMRKANIAYNFSTMKDEMPTTHEDIVMLYNANRRTHNFGDITRVNPKDLPDMDLFTYSFPCKNISEAGDQTGFTKGSGTQSSLVWECEKIIEEKRPKYLMMENVKDILNKYNMETFREWIALLKSYGYKSQWKLYNSADYGVPQNRERVIMLSEQIKEK